MKRVYVLLLALLLALTGCAGKTKAKDITVKNVCCPYKIEHKKNAIALTLQNGENEGLLWNVEAIPEDVFQVTLEDVQKDSTYKYRIAGQEEGAAQLRFFAQREDETVVFELILVANIDSEGTVEVVSSQHQERVEASVAADGLNYNWNVDVAGMLHFSFLNEEDVWFVLGDGDGVCSLSNEMTSPAGCRFSAQAITEGKTTIRLVGETTQREIQVVLEVNDDQKIEVVSVQEY